MRDFIFISSIEWNRLWQSHHELASRIAETGRRVLFIDNTGVRAPSLRDAGRVAARVRSFATDVPRGGAHEVAPRLWVASPLALPPLGSRLGRGVNRRRLVPRMRAVAEAVGIQDPVIWTYLPTDTALDVVDGLSTPETILVYACLADFHLLASRPRKLIAYEEQLLGRADLVFALPGLADRCSQSARGRVVAMRPPVSTDRFVPPIGGRRRNGAPVIGYVGGLHRHVDVGLLAELATSRPDWRFELVGPIQQPPGALEGLGNVRLIGEVPHADLPALIASFDVGLVPYRVSPYTRTAAPTKLAEYLSMGCPVVTTPLPYAAELQREYGLIEIAEPRAAAFAAAISAAIADDREELRARRRAMAETLSWGNALDDLLEAVRSVDPRAAARAGGAPGAGGVRGGS